MRSTLFRVSAVCLLALLYTMNSRADVRISDAWMRLLPPTSKMTAAYMRIQSDTDDRLVSVSSEVATDIEIHVSMMKDGVMSMRHLDQGLVLPAGELVELKPRSYHLMVMGLTQKLKAEQVYDFTLVFEHAPPQRVQVKVLKP